MSSSLIQFLLSGFYSWRPFQILLTTALISFTIWYMQFRWGRRKLYKHSRNIQGPPSLPIIGSAHYFLGSAEDIFKSLMWVFDTYPGLSRVWYGPRLFYTVTIPEHIEIILNSPKAYRKEDWHKYFEPVVGTGLLTAQVDQWKRHRKIIMPSFNKRILDNFVEIFSTQSEKLVDQLKKYSGKNEFDIFHVISKCSLDTICETAMGVQVNAQTTNSQFGEIVDIAMEIAFFRLFVFWYHFDFIFNLSSHSKEHNNAVKFLREFTENVVKEKRIIFERKMLDKNSYEDHPEEGNRRRVFLDYLLELSTQEGQKFTDIELIDEVITFLITGSDTTSSTASFLFIVLGIFPDVQQKIYGEVIEIIGHERNVEATDLPQMKYLERVIKETLRLFPVTASIVRAIDEEIDLKDGHILPKGSSTVIGILHIHRSEKYWPDPLKFDPDRFLPEEIAKRHPCSYIPFSHGPRNCIGHRYGMMAMKSLIATVVRSYKIRTSYKSIEEIELKMHLVMRPLNGYNVSFHARNP